MHTEERPNDLEFFRETRNSPFRPIATTGGFIRNFKMAVYSRSKQIGSNKSVSSTSNFFSGYIVTFIHFYPTALKGCRGIVFTHGVRMGGWAGGGK